MRYSKFIHSIVLAIGIFSMYLSYAYFIGAEDLPKGGVSCRALCGLTMLSEQIFGSAFARYTAGTLWLVTGGGLCLLSASGLMKNSNS